MTSYSLIKNRRPSQSKIKKILIYLSEEKRLKGKLSYL